MGQYEGSNVATGSQTPENVTSPTDISTDVFDSGVAGGTNTANDEA
jgi:hypothetical protein